MHARYRNGPGNGYRPNAMGVRGMAGPPQIFPEGPIRGPRMYNNSEHRSYNRGGYGRGDIPKQFPPPPPPPPPREPDIFMEAGRLAAEYLVSKGVLPPIALSGKWQNDGLKNQLREFQGFRPREVENLQFPVDSRSSGHSRFGNAAPDVGPDRRRYSDEFNSARSRNSTRETRRTMSFKSYGSEANKELVRSVSSVEKTRASPGMDADRDAPAGNRDEQPVGGKDGKEEVQNSSSGVKSQEGVNPSRVESEIEKCNSVEDTNSKSSSLADMKNLPSNAGEPTKESDDVNKLTVDADAGKEEKIDDDMEENQDNNEEVRPLSREGSLVNDDDLDLLKQSKFVNIPTKARSSLTSKGSKSEQVPMNEVENVSDRELSELSGVHSMDVAIDSSTCNSSSQQNNELKSLEPDALSAATVEKQLDDTDITEPGHSLRSESLLERSIDKEPEPEEGLSGFCGSNSMFGEKGGKRAIDDDADPREDSKRLKEWIHPMVAQFDGSPPLSSSMENHSDLQEPRTSQGDHAAQSDDQKSLNISLFPQDHASSSEFMEEKQLFPGSFKTCDLNLVGTSDIHDNHDSNHVLIFPSVTESGKDAAIIDVDLSMSNNCNPPSKSGKHGLNVNDIEVIDLENDSAPEDQAFSTSQRRGDTVFTDLDGFNSNVHNANEIPDVQDGYGLMISELLGNGSPNSSSVATDLNSLHNHMGLPNTEGILGDDDSIYMSLGEIPISLLGAWEQPTQDYGKPF